jgi:hypothetical protein
MEHLPNQKNNEEMLREINRAIEEIPVRKADILRWYFGLDGNSPMTLEEIADRIELTAARVQQIRNNAIRRLPKNIQEELETMKRNAIRHLRIPAPRRIIREGEFSNCKELLTVEMPASVNFIEESAFWGCHKLERVILPKGLKIIGICAFFDCWSLESIYLPEGLRMIEIGAFGKCFELREIVVPKSVRFIDEDAFLMCQNLHIRIPEKTFVAENAFRDGKNYKIERY